MTSSETQSSKDELDCFSAFPAIQSFVLLAQQVGFERDSALVQHKLCLNG